jgi:hypothetical protein
LETGNSCLEEAADHVSEIMVVSSRLNFALADGGWKHCRFVTFVRNSFWTLSMEKLKCVTYINAFGISVVSWSGTGTVFTSLDMEKKPASKML